MCRMKLLLVALALVSVSQYALAQHDHAQHGKVDFELSCNEGAQAHFNLGLGLLHHMMYDQAAAHFAEAAEADAECAMAHWGTAMTQMHPLWAPPTKAELEKGREAVERARTLSAKDEREAAYIAAVGAFFDGDDSRPFPERLAAWRDGQKSVREMAPDDLEAGAWYALSLIATAPKDDKTFAQNAKAGKILEALLEQAPEHPGLFHYTIHTYDNPVLAENALDVARAYDQLAPEVPHALHMPSHIFVRRGMWADVISWNRRSADAALAQPVGDVVSMHFPHAMDYLVYAHLQQGEDSAAQDALDEMLSVGAVQPNLAAAYGMAAARARYALERRAWQDAAALEVRVPEHFAWEDFPAAEAIIHFARGIGAARSDNLDVAKEAKQSLKTLHGRLVEAGDAYWATLVDAQVKSVAAWLALANGDTDGALALMREAAGVEDSVDKHPVTPSAVRPARELLGDMLLATGHHDEAIEAYEGSLATSPGRLNSLYGAGVAAEALGDDDRATVYFSQIEEKLANAEATRGDLSMRDFLSTARP